MYMTLFIKCFTCVCLVFFPGKRDVMYLADLTALQNTFTQVEQWRQEYTKMELYKVFPKNLKMSHLGFFFQINFALKAKMRNRYKNVMIRETGQTNMGMEFFARVSRQNSPPIIFLENLNLKIMLELHFHGLQELRFTGLGPSAETTAPKL